MAIAPALLAIVITVFTAIGFGGGYLISDWQNGTKIAKVEGENTVLSAANDKCAEDVANTQAAMNTIKAATNELERQAAKAIQEATPKVEERKRIIKAIKAKPSVALDMQCEAIKQEQIDYVQARRRE